ncbi:DUF6265 family protein [Niabella sp.]|uniref:DUF6265 family protein n=1 Tax=Niabella sp. TaxID=1962976 RepID=UPI0026020785|nr:DUF6265 family protein [Niabella sp.]
MYSKTKRILISALFFLCCWKADTTPTIRNAEWLAGTWENRVAPGKIIYETWTRSGDAALTGKSYMLKEKDTLLFETVKLVEKNGRLLYIATVPRQNNGEPVVFTSKTVSETELIFENPEHDFPQRIRYTRVGADSLLAEISGTKNGNERKQSFPMKRVH